MAPHGANVRFFKANRQAALGAKQDVILAGRDCHADKLIAFLKTNGDDAALADVRVGAKGRFLHDAVGGREDEEVLFLGEILHRKNAIDLLALLQRKQIRD